MSQIVESLFEKIKARDVNTSCKLNINNLLDGKGCDNMPRILVTID